MKDIILIFVFFLCLTACSERSTDNFGEVIEDVDLAYLLFTRANVGLVNSDAEVKDLTILVFDATTKELKLVKQTSLDTASKSFLKVKPGFYDFYFLANVSSQNIQWSSIRSVGDLQKLKLRLLSSEADMLKFGIPMIDCITSIHVDKGGSESHPTLFADLRGGREIELLRTVSKIDVRLIGSGFISTDTRSNHQIASIHLMNMSEHISPFQSEDKEVSLINLPLRVNAVNGYNQALESTVYVPNINIKSDLFWVSNSKNIPYLKIRLITGEEFQTPLVSNHDGNWNIDYMSFAAGTQSGPNNEYPIYSICANTNYKYQFKLDNNELKVDLSISPWVKEELINEEFIKPTYHGSTIYLRSKDQLIGNKIQIRKDELTPSFSMWLKQPKDATWRLNLTNGLNFRFTEQTSYGVADPISDTGTHFLYVTSRVVPQPNTIACTDIYFTINNEEVPMVVIFNDGSSKEFYGKNRLKIELVN